MGERLEIFINALGMKKKDFAVVLGLHQPALYPFIGEDAKLPKDEIVVKIAAMGMNVHWWVTGEGSMYADNEAGRSLAAKNGSTVSVKEPSVTSEEIAVLRSLLTKLEAGQ